MIHHACPQGGEEWRKLRVGRPTASCFDRIITPKKQEPTKSETRWGYQVELLTELILGMPLEGPRTAAMLHGHDWEAKAIAAYEMENGIDVEPCGFCTTDDGLIGASPDSFVGADGSLEIKCPFSPEIHVANMLKPEGFATDHFVQTQGQLYVTGRKWTDLVSYFGGLPMVQVRVHPHAEFQGKLDAALKTFVCELSDLIERATKAGWIKPEAKPEDHSRDWLTQGEVDRYIASFKGAQ